MPEHCACAHVESPGAFALSGVTHSEVGLLMCAHSERLARATRSVVSDEIGGGEREREGRASGPLVVLLCFCECECERVSGKAGDGARVGAVGRR